jgi:hypothetical protein
MSEPSLKTNLVLDGVNYVHWITTFDSRLPYVACGTCMLILIVIDLTNDVEHLHRDDAILLVLGQHTGQASSCR